MACCLPQWGLHFLHLGLLLLLLLLCLLLHHHLAWRLCWPLPAWEPAHLMLHLHPQRKT
jgi:hypothetical protein